MKLLINNEYQDVGFFSFMKCMILIELTLAVVLYSLGFVVFLLLN